MKRCTHAVYCEHAPHMCATFLGNPLNYIVGGCPLVPMQEEIDRAKAKAGGLSLAGPADGALSIAPDVG